MSRYIGPHHWELIDAIGTGKHRSVEIAQAVRRPVEQVHARLAELRRAGVVRAERGIRPGVHGRPPKLYRLNPWSERP